MILPELLSSGIGLSARTFFSGPFSDHVSLVHPATSTVKYYKERLHLKVYFIRRRTGRVDLVVISPYRSLRAGG